MWTTDERYWSRYRSFLSDLYLLCRKHAVEIDGGYDAGPCAALPDGVPAECLFVNALGAERDDVDGVTLEHEP